MDQQTYNQLISFIWNIANDCLVNTYNKGDYRKIILPMMVLRRFDAVLEPTKKQVLEMKAKLDENGILDQDAALCQMTGQAFCNSSPYMLKDLKARTKRQQLREDFTLYLDGFSANVQEIISKFKLRNELETLLDADVLHMLIEKFVDPKINLSAQPVLNDDGSIKLPALDNHSMGTAFEELLRRFNEENNVTEAGEHFTPRDVVELMTDLAFMPLEDKIIDSTYFIYDGACGTGGILSVAEEHMKALAQKGGKRISTYLYGQEIQPETYATAKADMLIKGEGDHAKNIVFGSTISEDGYPTTTFDFMISNPPFGTPWKKDLETWGFKDKKEITDKRFILNYAGNPEYSVIPNIGDPQMLFLANNISKMKKNTALGSRVVEVHNGSSLFTGNAGQGESNLRRYIIENDLLEAIVALPGNLFYNTPLNTYLWIVTNRKEKRRIGKVQLIDATGLKSALRKNLGDKNGELTKSIRDEVLKLLMDFSENERSKIFDGSEFGYYKITVCRPEYDESGKIVLDKKGKPKVGTTDTEQVPLSYFGGVHAFFEKEVLPYTPDAWIDEKKTEIGYELSFTKYFYKPVELRPLSEIVADIKALEQETDGLLAEILGG